MRGAGTIVYMFEDGAKVKICALRVNNLHTQPVSQFVISTAHVTVQTF